MDNALDQLLSLCGQFGVPLPVQQPAVVPPLVGSPGNGTAPIAVSLCTGAGGLDLGLERAGFEVVLACENDPDARATIAANRPGLPILDDLQSYTAADVRTAAGLGEDIDIDLVAAGPPCQSFSFAGKRRGTGDERGEVLLKFITLAMSLKSRYIAVENVPGLVSDPAFDQVLRRLRDGGYVVSWNIYNAACFGSPQKRERVIVIASRDGRVPHLTPTYSDRPGDGLPAWRTLRDAIGDMTGIEHHYIRYPAQRLKWFRRLKPGQDWRDLPPEAVSEAVRKGAGGGTGFYRRLRWDKPASTLMTVPDNLMSGCCHPDHARPLSVEEYRRVQGFPDHWQVCGNLRSQYKQLGNAVPMPLGEAVGKTIIEHIRTRRSEDPVPGFHYSRFKNASDRDWHTVEPHERTNIMDNNFDTLDQLQALCGQLGIPVPPPPPPAPPAPEPVALPAPEPVLYQPAPGIDCWERCDFRSLPLEPGAVDAVITDVPWDEKWLRRYGEEFALWCVRVLKPGGIMATWYGQQNLAECMEVLGKHLRYQWMLVSPFYGTVPAKPRFFTCRYRPALVYTSGETIRLQRAVDDFTPGARREKDSGHPMQQSIAPTQYLVESFSRKGDLIADPCAGSWTTAKACWHTHRNFVGAENDPQWFGLARKRFANLLTT